MEFKRALFLVAFIVGCTAIPTPEQEDLSIFFEHVDRSARIVGGSEAQAGSHPHMVAMTTGSWLRSLACGGSIISQRQVLTAAHCIEAVFSWGSLSSSLLVTVGTNRWNSGGQSYAIARNITHQNYNAATIKNDIGILITANAIALSPLVQTIPLTYDYIGAGVPSRVAGWGRIRAGGAISATLLELSTATLDGQQCARDAAVASVVLNMRAPPVDPTLEVCTFHSAGRGNCNGDSGSALVRTDRGQQIGIVSWGFPCALGAPDMYVRISAYRNWIAQSN